MALLENESEGKLKFGFGQIPNRTPKWARWTFRIFFYTTGIVTSLVDIFTEIPTDVKLTITAAVLKSNLLIHALSKMFGIDVDQYDPNRAQ